MKNICPTQSKALSHLNSAMKHLGAHRLKTSAQMFGFGGGDQKSKLEELEEWKMSEMKRHDEACRQHEFEIEKSEIPQTKKRLEAELHRMKTKARSRPSQIEQEYEKRKAGILNAPDTAPEQSYVGQKRPQSDTRIAPSAQVPRTAEQRYPTADQVRRMQAQHQWQIQQNKKSPTSTTTSTPTSTTTSTSTSVTTSKTPTTTSTSTSLLLKMGLTKGQIVEVFSSHHKDDAIYAILKWHNGSAQVFYEVTVDKSLRDVKQLILQDSHTGQNMLLFHELQVVTVQQKAASTSREKQRAPLSVSVIPSRVLPHMFKCLSLERPNVISATLLFYATNWNGIEENPIVNARVFGSSMPYLNELIQVHREFDEQAKNAYRDHPKVVHIQNAPQHKRTWRCNVTFKEVVQYVKQEQARSAHAISAQQDPQTSRAAHTMSAQQEPQTSRAAYTAMSAQKEPQTSRPAHTAQVTHRRALRPGSGSAAQARGRTVIDVPYGVKYSPAFTTPAISAQQEPQTSREEANASKVNEQTSDLEQIADHEIIDGVAVESLSSSATDYIDGIQIDSYTTPPDDSAFSSAFRKKN